MEEWMSSKGNWKESKLYQHMTLKKMERTHGARVWLTRSQLVKKYDSEEIADDICNTKLTDAELYESHTKPHPDCPQNEAGPFLDFLVVGYDCSVLK